MKHIEAIYEKPPKTICSPVALPICKAASSRINFCTVLFSKSGSKPCLVVVKTPLVFRIINQQLMAIYGR